MATAAATRNARMNPLMRLSRIDRDSEGFAEACEDTVYRLRVRPANHGDEIVHGIDPDEIAAGAAGAEALRRRARIGLRPRVQHPHEAVVRVERRRRDRLRDPALRHQLAIAPAPLLSMRRPSRAWSRACMNMPPPQCPPPATDCIR